MSQNLVQLSAETFACHDYVMEMSCLQVDVRRMTPLETSELLNQLMAEAQDEANLLLLKLRKRLDK